MWLPSAAQYYSRSNIKEKISEWAIAGMWPSR